MAGVVATLTSPQRPEYAGSRKVERYSLTNGSPTILPGTGAGSATGGTANFSGSPGGTATDVAGQITVINGTTSIAAGTICVVAFANTMQGTVNPTFTPANATALALGGATLPLVQANAGSFWLLLGS